ncbi:MAG: chemotaxis protein CheA [Phycisphaerales bacterium]|nr:MAG: chemotaxis protein CheA [Phycisphaerales bacterium]
MSTNGFDPEILQDFLTESGELLEQLESDLVELEDHAQDTDLLNKVFRALHTIKGSASFLALTNLVTIAHAAESALNAARNGTVIVDRPVMDRLLQAVDLIKRQMGQIQRGQQTLEIPPAKLVADLAGIGEGKPISASKPTTAKSTTAAKSMTGVKSTSSAKVGITKATSKSATKTASKAPSKAALKQRKSRSSKAGTTDEVAVATIELTSPTTGESTRDVSGITSELPADLSWSVSPLELDSGKADLLEYLVADIEETLTKLDTLVSELGARSKADECGEHLGELALGLAKAVDFFNFESMQHVAYQLNELGRTMATTHEVEENTPRARLMSEILRHQCRGLKDKEMRVCDPASYANAGIETIDEIADESVTGPIDESASTPEAASVAPTAARSDEERKIVIQESTIRVEVGRLESLMNLVGELVLQKNRLSSLSRRLAGETLQDAELAESISLASGNLDRVTGDIQMAVMRTRMQPLDKLFGKYPRLIRDLASKTGKKMRLVIEGGETEVDKSVIEELGDPLIHLLRNSADHGIEMPLDRVKAGKSDEGTITIRASHEGGHVRLQILDDGRGLHRDRIGKKAIERGLCTEAELASLPDREVYKFIFGAGFSTAEQVSDLSGRGVGMDVVRTNIEKIKGSIDLASEPGQGTTLTITIPLTVAIMPAMMVAVSNEIYAVPLGNILEIVKPEASSISSIGEHPVIRMRDGVLPLLSAVDAFNVPMEADGSRPKTPFVVVLALNDRRIGLTVSRLIGQQEIVVKPLDSVVDHKGGPVSGATVRDDGGVSLIVDVTQLMAMSQSLAVRAA